MTHKLLKLPSQRQLVDRLLHLIEFDSPFILLCGKPGSGRGTLCGSLLDRLPDNVRVVRLIGSAAMKMAEVRQSLLQPLVARPLFNPQDALADSFFRMLDGKPVNLLLLVERADELPAELVPELWALCRHNDALARPHKLVILLSGGDDWCRTQTCALKGRAMPALELAVSPLSPPEQRIFLYEKAKAFNIPTALLPRPRVEEILNGANGHPSAIMQSLEAIMTDRRPRKRQAELPVKKIATLLALVAAGLLALSYLPLFDGQDKDAGSQPGGSLPSPVATAPLAVGAASGDQASGTPAGGQNGNPPGQDWQTDAKTLPKQVEGGTITAESTNYEGRRVVIADEVVEKLMTQPGVSGALPVEVVNELTGVSAQGSVPAGKAAAEPVAAPAPGVALTPVATLSRKPASHYSIQLMGASNPRTVDGFVAEHGLAGKVWVYKTLFRGSPWYVVVQGEYAGSAQAKAAIRKLSPALLKGQPWPKSFAQIQKELKQ